MANVFIDIGIQKRLMMWILYCQQKYGTPVYSLDAQTMLQKSYNISHLFV